MRKQRRKQILCFITVILLIILVSMLLPYGIRAVSNIFMDYIAKEAETETVREPETGNTSVSVSGSENAKGNNAPVTELENLPAETDTEILSKETDTRSQEKAEYDAGLKQYRGSVDPEYKILSMVGRNSSVMRWQTTCMGYMMTAIPLTV